jgi:surface polysaccharide O-acyltransferase-like enzyme
VIAQLQARLRRVTGSGAYIAQIDGLRFFAILPVVMFHLASRSWRAFSPIADPTAADESLIAIQYRLWPANAGVELFFVISGVILWWRTRRTFQLRLWPKRMSRPSIVMRHRDLGVIAAPLLLISIVTGTMMTDRGAEVALARAALEALAR